MTSKKNILQLKLSQIRTDGGTQSRVEIDSDTVNRYADDLKEGAVFPAVIVFYDGTHYWLASGFHRHEAHDMAGRKTIEADVRQGTVRDAKLFSVGCNYQHGLQRTHKDKRKACRMLLEDEEWWEKTNVWIADKCHVSDYLVKQIREEMEEEWEEEERKQKEKEEKEAAAQAANSSTQGARVENPGGSTQGSRNENASRPRVGRSRHGGTRTLNTANQGKGKKGTKPVYIEHDAKQIKKLQKQEDRSWPKAVRQSKRLNRTLDEVIALVKKLWDEIEVIDEGA